MRDEGLGIRDSVFLHQPPHRRPADLQLTGGSGDFPAVPSEQRSRPRQNQVIGIAAIAKPPELRVERVDTRELAQLLCHKQQKGGRE